MNSEKIAIIDLGSNSFHMELFAVEKEKIVTIDRLHFDNRLAEKVSKSRAILPSSLLAESVDTVNTLIAHAKILQATKINIFATGIFRQIKNESIFFDLIFTKTGFKVELLSEQKEAKLTFYAVKHRHTFTSDSLVLDMGGGSTEFIFVKNNKFNSFVSVPVGTAFFSETISKALPTQQKKIILEKFDDVLKKARGFSFLIGTSGFMRLASFDKYGKNMEALLPLSQTDVEKTYLRYKDDKSGKSFLAGGAFALKLIMQEIGIKQINVSAASTREGYLLSIIK